MKWANRDEQKKKIIDTGRPGGDFIINTTQLS